MRLGFAIASHVDAPIIVLDEVLGVGDEGFQKKSCRKLEELFKSGKTVGWNDNTTTSGHYVTLNREAAFARGPATEQFIFRVDGNRALLVGYQVNSDLLITG